MGKSKRKRVQTVIYKRLHRITIYQATKVRGWSQRVTNNHCSTLGAAASFVSNERGILVTMPSYTSCPNV